MLDDLRSALHRLDRQQKVLEKGIPVRVKKTRRNETAARVRKLNGETSKTMTDNRNTILAVILSGLVLIAWQYFYNMPQMERQRAQTQTQAELNKPSPQTAPGSRLPRIDHAATGRGADPPPRRRPAGRGSAGRQPRRRDRGLAAHQDRDAAGFRQHRAEGRAHRRPVAGEIPRHRRSEVARDRAVLAFEHGPSLLCRVRLGRGLGLDGAAARPRYGVAAGGLRQPDARATR